jgi:transposase
MDTSTATISTDSLGRRSGPRQRRSASEKRRIVEESLRPGVSVAVVARRHEVNANSVFGWRRQYQKGLLGNPAVQLLPVSVAAQTVAPKPPTRQPRSTPSKASAESVVQLELAGGMRVRVQGELARELIKQLIEGMLAR